MLKHVFMLTTTSAIENIRGAACISDADLNSGLPEKKTENNFRTEVDTGDFYEQSRFFFSSL